MWVGFIWAEVFIGVLVVINICGLWLVRWGADGCVGYLVGGATDCKGVLHHYFIHQLILSFIHLFQLLPKKCGLVRSRVYLTWKLPIG